VPENCGFSLKVKVDDAAYIYVNGQYVGYAHDFWNETTFNIKPFLITGDNLIAVQCVDVAQTFAWFSAKLDKTCN
jgi:beta-galactosidase/beta-glucuronidase